jgi:DNA-binding NarL/FixJ family response regulator
LPVRILIVDDHPVARDAIRALLTRYSLHVCGEAQNGSEAIKLVAELKPEIVLLDVNMPVMDGLSAAREIRRIAPGTILVFLTVHESSAIVNALRLWSDGFVAKSEVGSKLIPKLNRLMEALRIGPPSLAQT